MQFNMPKKEWASSSLQNTKNKFSTYLSSTVGLFCCDPKRASFIVLKKIVSKFYNNMKWNIVKKPC